MREQLPLCGLPAARLSLGGCSSVPGRACDVMHDYTGDWYDIITGFHILLGGYVAAVGGNWWLWMYCTFVIWSFRDICRY